MNVYICHQVNCQGKMGAGFAKQVAQWMPQAKQDYINFCYKYDKKNLLGRYLLSKIRDHVYIVHLFGQYRYGTKERNTDYDALACAITSFRMDYPVTPDNVCVCPEMMGCALGGGNWTEVKSILDQYDILPMKYINLKKIANGTEEEVQKMFQGLKH